MTEKAHKVIKLRILKPANEMTWQQLGEILRDARYRVFRLANLVVSEAYLNFHLWRTGRSEEFATEKIGKVNRRLREYLQEEKVAQEKLDRFSKTGALPDTVVGALTQYKLAGLTKNSKWSQVVRGKASLPTFRANMAIPVRCDKPDFRRLERCENGDVVVDLMVCRQPYPRVVLQTGKIGEGPKAILDRLLDNAHQDPSRYRQRCFEIKFDERDKKWWLFVTYDFPQQDAPNIDPNRVVGVDLGVACPVYAALSNGHARLGWRQFAAVAARVKSLQTQVMSRRRSLLTGGKASLSSDTARSGHGRKRKLASIEPLNDRINRAYTTLNHQLSSAVVQFAIQHGAGIIQIEELDGLKDKLTGTFLGQRWRYHQLQNFLEYKGKEAGIEVRRVNPRFTSRRCSACGFIHAEFDRAFRDANRTNNKTTRFVCPQCQYEADPDYNAARNLATVDIAAQIKEQCKQQGIAYDSSLEI